MGRVPEAELERLRCEVSVQRLAEARGVKLKQHGADLIGLCPFHDDQRPSLVISPAKNHCLGACQAGGVADRRPRKTDDFSTVAQGDPMTEQKLTISNIYRPGWHVFPHRQQVPLLQLAGLWLIEAGFPAGSEVLVQAEYGRLVVTLREPEPEEQ